MCKIGIIKILRNRFHPKHHSSNSETIQFTQINLYNIIITKVDKTDNFNPNATNVNNTYYDQEPADDETDEETDDDLEKEV
jgi:hypothetical protein